MINKTNRDYYQLRKDDLRNLLFNSDEVITVADLGQWLECKTNSQYVIVQCDFLQEIFALLNTINIMNKGFKEKWLNSLDTIKVHHLKHNDKFTTNEGK